MNWLEKLNKSSSAVFKFIPGPIFGLASVIIGLGGDALALLLTPYYNLDLMVSKLGVGPGGIFFNIGTILSGLFTVPFYIYLEIVLKREEINSKVLEGALGSALISCLFFILIGFFPSNNSNLLILYLHGVFSLFSFLSGLSYFLLFSYLLFNSSQFMKFHAYIGFFQVAIIILFLFTWNPISEWLMTFGLIIWIMTISTYLHYKKI
jgi:hypothetical protein